MVNVCLETNGSRPRLLEQTLRTLYENTPTDQFTLAIIHDGPSDFVTDFGEASDSCIRRILARSTSPDVWWSKQVSILEITPATYVTGRLKNLGAYWSEKQFGRGEWLLFIDDDVAFVPGWLEKMTITMITCQSQAMKETSPVLGVLGGNRHPYHGVNEEWVLPYEGQSVIAERNVVLSCPIFSSVQITDAVAGYSMLMRWGTFDKYGPFDSWAKGISQSEDFSFARRIVDDGGKVGYIHPPVLYHTGVTNSSGQPATGAEKIERVPGILYL